MQFEKFSNKHKKQTQINEKKDKDNPINLVFIYTNQGLFKESLRIQKKKTKKIKSHTGVLHLHHKVLFFVLFKDSLICFALSYPPTVLNRLKDLRNLSYFMCLWRTVVWGWLFTARVFSIIKAFGLFISIIMLLYSAHFSHWLYLCLLISSFLFVLFLSFSLYTKLFTYFTIFFFFSCLLVLYFKEA